MHSVQLIMTLDLGWCTQQITPSQNTALIVINACLIVFYLSLLLFGIYNTVAFLVK